MGNGRKGSKKKAVIEKQRFLHISLCLKENFKQELLLVQAAKKQLLQDQAIFLNVCKANISTCTSQN